MLRLDEAQRNEIIRVWKSPKTVVNLVYAFLYEFPESIVLDEETKVNFAKNIGLMVGEMENCDPGAFIMKFERTILNRRY